ncbi:MAG TPA: Hsp20/alpha crystallin family protein [Polyangiales bacterium]
MLSVWDPFADLNRFQREFEKSFFQGRNRPADFAPMVDVHEDDEALVLRADLPGVKREDIEIQVDGNVLTLKGERKLESESEKRRYHRVERSYGSFVRQWQLPTNVDATKVDAAFDNGILTLKLPKKEEQKARKIEIRGS